ncbi:MAG: TlpA family protein disulfide reductase [Chloroflexi bacterium]|nr:TlpA family protein disulfide reductase [Chloroflexota bacterium]
MNFSAVMVVLVMAAVAVFASLYNGASQSANPQNNPATIMQVPPSSGGGTNTGSAGDERPVPTAPAELRHAQQLVGSAAPDVSFTNIQTGEVTRLLASPGTPMLLTIWDTKCSPCHSLAASMQQAYSKYKGNVEFVSVSFGPRDDSAGVKAFVDQNGYGWTFLHAANAASIPYSVEAVPVAYFIGGDGIIHAAQVGGMDAQMLVGNLDSLLKAPK